MMIKRDEAGGPVDLRFFSDEIRALAKPPDMLVRYSPRCRLILFLRRLVGRETVDRFSGLPKS